MGNYFDASNQKRERKREPHPIWRGIGFAMIIIIPLFSFAGADLLVQYLRTSGVTLPTQLRADTIELPVYGPLTDYKAVLVVAAVIAMILFGLFTLINAAMYQASSGKTYQVFESEPQAYKKKRKLKKPNYD